MNKNDIEKKLDELIDRHDKLKQIIISVLIFLIVTIWGFIALMQI